MVYALRLERSVERHGGSSPLLGTNLEVMMSYTVGIVGKGFVGGAMYENFKDIFQTLVWDIDISKRNVASFEDFVEKSDIIFVCVPTPMKDDGSCDTYIVRSVIDDIAQVDRRKYVVIKSTVTPGTTERLASDFSMIIGFNPEFLTEANAYNDFRQQPLIILGADDTGLGTVMAQIYYEFNSAVDGRSHIIQRTTKEAELFKYLANSFLATKVIFANEFKNLCDKVDVDYGRIAELAVLDKRLGHTHWRVPGPDGQRGFGGSCFPKDTSALISYADEIGTSLWLLNEATYINDEIRGENFHKLELVKDK
jgi:UDPglucose 6-dehydrogenase